MAPRSIVSWGYNEICISPVPSKTASIVSFDSTFSDTYPSHSQMSPIVPEVPELRCADLGAKHTSLPGLSQGKKTRGGHGDATLDDSFIRHDAYFFKDGNATFLVGGTLYCVHRYFFSRDSVYFSTRFAQLDIRDHEALPTIISIGDVERNDFEALLSILYPTNFEAHELSYEQWKSVLHLSTRWGFSSLRQLALKSIKPPTPYDQLVLARTYSVDHWALPALTALCERTLPLNLNEAREMNMEDVVLVATVREEIRGGALRIDAADIPRHIEVVQAGKLNRYMGNDVFWDGPKSGITGKETMASAVDPNVAAVASPSGPQHKHKRAKEGDTHGSDVERSSKEVPVELPGVEQPHVAEGTPQDWLKSAATPAVQKRETRKSEEASGQVASAGRPSHWSCPKAQAEAMLTENRAVGAIARLDAEARVKAETVRCLDAEAAKDCAYVEQEEAAHAKAKADAEAKKAAVEAKRAEAKIKREAEAKAEAEVAAKAKAEAESRQAKIEARAKAKAKADAEAKEKWEAEAKEEADARASEEAKVKAAKEAKAAAAKAELEAKQKAEKERLEIEAKSKVEAAMANAKTEEERTRVYAEKADLRVQQAQEQIARQRAADRAVRAVAGASASSLMRPDWNFGGSWSGKVASVASSAIFPMEEPAPPVKPSSLPNRHVGNASSPSTELGPLRGPAGPGTLADHFIGRAGDRKGNQATAALPAEAAADKPVPFKTIDASKTCDMVGGAAAPDALSDKYAHSAPTSCKAESTRAQETAPAESVADFESIKHPDPAPTLSLLPENPCQPRLLPERLPLQMPRQPCLVPGGLPLQTPQQSDLSPRRTPPESDATLTKEHAPTPQSAAPAYTKPNGDPETPNVPGAKNAGETPAQTKISPAAAQVSGGVKPDGAATEAMLRLRQHSEAGGWWPAIPKGGHANPEGQAKPTLRPDYIREVSTASAMSASSPGTPANEAPLSQLEEEWGRAELSRAQKKRLRERAKQQAQMGEKIIPHPPSGATSKSLDNSVLQEPKPVATAPVDTYSYRGGRRCPRGCESGEDENWDW